MIYVSFPSKPNVYPDRADYNPEKSHHIYYGLKNNYQNVEWIDYYSPPVGFNPEKDILITEVFGNYGAAPRSRVILVENSNFESNKYFHDGKARYTKYGVNSDNEIDNNDVSNITMNGVAGILMLSNDIAIHRYNTNHPDVLAYKGLLNTMTTNIDMVPHPLDKNRYLKFFNADFIAAPRMLIHHAGNRKNSLQFVQMVKELGYQEEKDWVQSPYWNKNDHNLLRYLNDHYHMIVSCSYSETGPVHLLESMYQGLLVLGHEEWWNAYNYDKTLWSYDPTKYQQMQNNVNWLMNSNNIEEIRHMRNDILKIYVNRTDNEWSYFLQKLYTMVDRLL